MEVKKLMGLSPLFMTVFLHSYSTFMVIPAITDVTMSAICPGEDECSIAIYLTGIQQVLVGMGTLVMMPLIGNLSDKYGRKALLTIPMTLTIIPLAILAYNRTKNYFYAYYALRTLTSMLCEGSVQCLALAYVADNIPENRRTSAFGILSGITSTAFVAGNLSARFISTPLTFQVSAVGAMIATVYMRVFLPESIADVGISALHSTKGDVNISLLEEDKTSVKIFKTMPSFHDSVSLLRSSVTFWQTAIVAFLVGIGDVALGDSILMILMPMLAPVIAEEKLLSIGLFFACAHMFLYSIAWSPWVPYAAAMFNVLSVFAQPALRSIASKQVGPHEQGKAQGCISGLGSFANILSPLVFSPLTALFLSGNPPFHFPGFSIACAGFAVMIAFAQSTMIKAAPPGSSSKSSSNCDCVEP
ncbi:hypothetical protein RHGRI_015830 [Rhododendron griersonianum]|uniref:Major facilitator superfamily (MFS) profile domain-containing protein n=1 Tax=Rhododendron griersonianum TaxID=479676 RepID=A0AAV6JNP9_9ERIC|nr:hypothetical protein RHGRI_015830 [Rhododendron griersonianum]